MYIYFVLLVLHGRHTQYIKFLLFRYKNDALGIVAVVLLRYTIDMMVDSLTTELFRLVKFKFWISHYFKKKSNFYLKLSRYLAHEKKYIFFFIFTCVKSLSCH